MSASPSVGPGNVVVTGASSGIGEACAIRLDAMGYRVFAGVRRTADAEALERKSSGRLTAVLLDVTDSASIASVVEAITAECGSSGLDGLINSAGTTLAAPVEFVPIGELRKLLEINVIGAVAVTQAFLPLLRLGRGRIVNISSSAARLVFPLSGPYAASKFALEALTDALRRELSPWGLTAISIQPGRTRTAMFDKLVSTIDAVLAAMPPEADKWYGRAMGRKRDSVHQGGGVPPERVAVLVAHALATPRPRARYIVGGWRQKALVALIRFLPDEVLDGIILSRQRANDEKVTGRAILEA